MAECNVIRGRNGNIGGAIGNGSGNGTVFSAKINAWKMNVTRDLFDESGFGDGGDSFFCEAVGQWAGGAAGLALAGTGTGGFDPLYLTGTNSAAGTISLTADTGVVYYGSVKIFNANVDTAYRGGGVAIQFQFRGHGRLNKA